MNEPGGTNDVVDTVAIQAGLRGRKNVVFRISCKLLQGQEVLLASFP